MHITHTRGHLLLARWRLAAAILLVACCVTLALAIGGTSPAMASVAANPVVHPNMPAATTVAATTESFQHKAGVSVEVRKDFMGNYWSLRFCRENGDHLVRGGRYTNYECINGSWLPFDWYELWAW